MRFRPPGVVPVELWNLEVAGAPLQSWRYGPAFPDVVALMVENLRKSPPTEWTSAVREQARAIGHVFLTGGGCGDPLIPQAFAAHGIALTVAQDPIFGAARAGSALFGAETTLCVDIGQTSVKASLAERSWRVDRDLARARQIEDVPMSDRAAARASTVRLLASAFHAHTAARLVLALPCEISDGGSCLASSYCWEDPDPELISDLISEAGFEADDVQVLNDAELAAIAAGRDDRVPLGEVVLVLTIGHGVGGALLERRR